MNDRRETEFQPKKNAKRYNGDDDRISQLPDDVLIGILSFLSVKEAAQTSILSSRWINLWQHISRLDFDADSELYKIAKRKKLRTGKRRKYINWVNRVLQSHKSLTLKEFRICFDLSRSAQSAITQWLEYAFARQVQRLELDLSVNCEGVDYPIPPLSYVFPNEFLTHIDFKSLKALSLKGVNVSGDAIEFFLHNCPLLEQLIVHDTERISNLEVCGSSLMLKHLEMCYCYYLKSLKVSAPYLTSLVVTRVEGLLLQNVPMLVEVSVDCGIIDRSVKYIRPALSCCISQLEILSLVLIDRKVINQLCDFPEMPKLKKLTVDYQAKGDDTLIGLSSLISASPHLREFVLVVSWSKVSRSDREVKDAGRFPHQHLKVVEFYGYYGRTSDFELVRYFWENCIALEKITIDPRYQVHYHHQPIPPVKIVAGRTARSHAKQQLEAQVPKHIELTIL